MREANLRGATLRHTILYHANLKGADLREADWGERPWLPLAEAASAIAWHSSKPWLAVSQGNTIMFQDNSTGQPIGQPLTGHSKDVSSVAFSPDGRWLASGSWDNTVRLWDVTEQKPIGQLKGHSSFVLSVAFSFDGRWLASGSLDHTVRLWDVTEQKLVGQPLTGHSGKVESVAFSPDGRWLASGSEDNTVRLWEVTTQKFLDKLTGHSYSVNSVAFSPNGSWLASGGSWNNTVRLWDVTTQKPAGLLTGHSNVVHSVAFSPDGRWLASGSSDKTVRLWDTTTQKPMSELRGHSMAVKSVAFNLKGHWLASGSDDKTVRLWEIKSGRSLGVISWHQAIFTVAVTTAHFLAQNDEDILNSLRLDEDGLAFGDGAGTISLWAVSRKDTSVRFVGMPSHSAMPLLVQGVELQGCRMDSQSKRLLELYGANVKEVLVEPPEEKRAQPSTTLVQETQNIAQTKVNSEDLSLSVQVSETVSPQTESKVSSSAKARRATLPSRTAPLNLPQSSTTQLKQPSLPSSQPKDNKSVGSTAKRGLFSFTTPRPWLASAPSSSQKSQPPITAYPQFFSAPQSEQKSPPSMKTPLLTTGALLKQAQELLNTACPPNAPARADLRRDFLKQLAEYKKADPAKPPTSAQQQALQNMMQLLRDIQGQSSLSQVASSSSTTYSSSST